jgi:hypothetical protein
MMLACAPDINEGMVTSLVAALLLEPLWLAAAEKELSPSRLLELALELELELEPEPEDAAPPPVPPSDDVAEKKSISPGLLEA